MCQRCPTQIHLTSQRPCNMLKAFKEQQMNFLNGETHGGGCIACIWNNNNNNVHVDTRNNNKK